MSSSSSSSPSTTESNNTGTIIGCVFGSLVLVAMIIVILFFWRQRSRHGPASRVVTVKPIGGKGDHSRPTTEAHYGASDSTDAILSPGTSSGHPRSLVKLSTPDPPWTKKGFVDSATISPLPNLNRLMPITPPQRNRRPRSTAVIYENTDNKRKSDTFLAMLPLSTETCPPINVVPSFPGRGASRKPVPTYDASEFDTSVSSGETGLVRPNARPMANRSSLLMVHGDKPVHHLIPDIPPPVKD